MKTLLFTCALFSLYQFSSLDAYCARCVQIESQREQEQALHPQQIGYYDDENSSRIVTAQSNASKGNEKATVTSYSPNKSKGEVAWNDASGPQNPGMEAENQASAKADQRLQEFKNQAQRLRDTDQKMMKEGYDPNEGYGGFRNPDLNQAYPNQEKIMQGQEAGRK